MLARNIGRAAAVAGFILSGAVAWAQADQKPAIPDALRQGVAQGAALCKANLGSAPPDLKLGEVEEFCTCMGVNEYAMQDMTNEAKASLRPRQQQMCMEIVRKQGQAAAPAPAQAAPPSSPPAPPATAEQPLANTPAPAAAAHPPVVERFEQWTITRNAAGAPIAFARATDTPSVGAFTMYCRAKDAIGFRVKYKSGFNEKKLVLPMGGYGIDISTDKNGVVPQASWAAFLKDWLETEKHTPPEVRKQADYSGVMDIEAQRRIIGKINLDGLTETRERMRTLCAEAIGRGAPAGNYLTTGLDSFDPEVIVGSAPNGTPSGVAVVAPSAPAESAQPVARRPGALPFEGTWRLRAEDACGSNMGMTITKSAIIQGTPGNISVSKIIAVKRVNEMAYRLTIDEVDKRRDGRPVRGTIHIGIENGNAISGDGPIFDGHSVEYLRCPDGAPAGEAAVAPKPKVAPSCLATFERNYAALRRKEVSLAGQTGAVMQNTPRFFWDFCPIVRQEVAAARQIIAATNACPSHPRSAAIRSEATAKLAKRQQELQRPRCM